MDGKLFSERLKQARQAKGWNQARLAEAIGVRQNTISNYEKGGMPKLESAADIAAALDVSLDWLVGLIDEQQEKEKNAELNGRSALSSLIWLVENHVVQLVDSLSRTSLNVPYPGQGEEDGIGIWMSGKRPHDLYKAIEGYLAAKRTLSVDSNLSREIIFTATEGVKNKMLDDYGDLFDPFELPF